MKTQKFKQTEIGKIPEDWEEVELEILGKIKTGKGTEKLSTGKYKLLGANGLIGFTNNFLEDSPLIYTGRVGTIGQINFQEKEKVWLSDNTLYFTCNNELLLKYVYYALKKNFGYLNVGSTQPLIKQSDFKKLNIQIPKNPPEQQAIAKILSSLDEKIELNNKMNKTLEEIGQAIFKKWFIDNPEKEKWEEKPLSNFIDLEKGLSYKGAGLTDDKKEIPMANLGTFNLISGFKQDGLKYYRGEYKERNLVKPGDLIIANTDMTQSRDILGSPAIIPQEINSEKVLFTHHTYAVRHKGSTLSNYFLYFLFQTPQYRERAIGFATGTTVLALPKDAIIEIDFKLPPKELLRNFDKLVLNIFNKISINNQQNQTLSQIRDALLPKLMSGEVRVK